MITDSELFARYGKLVHIEKYIPSHDRWDLIYRYITTDKANELAQEHEKQGDLVRIIEEL